MHLSVGDHAMTMKNQRSAPLLRLQFCMHQQHTTAAGMTASERHITGWASGYAKHWCHTHALATRRSLALRERYNYSKQSGQQPVTQ